MKDLNQVALVGRLTRDAEAPQGSGPARFSIAVNRPKKQGDSYVDEASFIDCEYWHKSLLPYLVKGKQIAVQGELRQERWNDRESGAARSKLVVVAQDIQLLGSREEGHSEAQTSTAGKVPATAAASAAPPRGAPAQASLGDEFTDDIPF
jgi:single-strand DNA-binding protein